MTKSLLFKKKWFLIPLILLLLIVGRIMTIEQREEVKGISRIQEESGIPVDVTRVRKQDIAVWEAFSGTVKGIRQGFIRANGSNVIEEVHVKVGDWVEKDQVVISLDPDYYQMGLSRYRFAKANYENALREVNRLDPLHKEGAISDREMDNARTALERAKAEWLAVRSWVDFGAPISGVVTFIGVEPGERAELGQLLATIADISSVRVILQVSDWNARLIKVGQEARVPGFNNLGEVRRVSISADPKTRLCEVEVVLDNPEEVLKPETIVDVEIAVDSKTETLVVPAEAVIKTEGSWAAYRVVDGRAEMKVIDVGLSNGNNVEVKDGLEEGDVVVVNGHNKLRGGEKVLIHQERNDALK